MDSLRMGLLAGIVLVVAPGVAQVGDVENHCGRFVGAVSPGSSTVMTMVQFREAMFGFCGDALDEADFDGLTELLGLSRAFSRRAAEEVSDWHCNYDDYNDIWLSGADDLFEEARNPEAFDVFSACAEFAYAGVRVSMGSPLTDDRFSLLLSRPAESGGTGGSLRVSEPEGVACRWQAGILDGAGAQETWRPANGAGGGPVHTERYPLDTGEAVSLECEVSPAQGSGGKAEGVFVFYERDRLFSVFRMPWPK